MKTKKRAWHGFLFLLALAVVPVGLYFATGIQLDPQYYLRYDTYWNFGTAGVFLLQYFFQKEHFGGIATNYLRDIIDLVLPAILVLSLYFSLLEWKRYRARSRRPVADGAFYPLLIAGGAVLMQIAFLMGLFLELLFGEIQTLGTELWWRFNFCYFSWMLEICLLFAGIVWCVDFMLEKKAAIREAEKRADAVAANAAADVPFEKAPVPSALERDRALAAELEGAPESPYSADWAPQDSAAPTEEKAPVEDES